MCRTLFGKKVSEAQVRLISLTAGSSFLWTAWAQVSNTPYRKYKVRAYEGGIATPLIISWPEVLESIATR